MSLRGTWRAALAAALLVGAAPPAGGELVVLVGGDAIKVAGYELRGEEARLHLPQGGTLTLSLMRVERVLEDEIAADPEPVPAPPDVALAWAGQEAPETPYGDVIRRVARDHRLNPELVAAIAAVESAFDPGAVSVKGARGLLQLMPATAERFGVPPESLFDPGANVEAGVRYLAWLIDRFDGDLPRVLAAYNAGEGVVDRYGGLPPYRETREFVRRVYSALGVEAPPTSAVGR